MRILISLVFLLTFGVSIGQVYNPTPQYVFKNKLGVGRSTAVDSAAYMNIGPNGGAVAGVVLPRVADTASITGTKRHGLLIFSNQLNSFAWYDSTAAVWTEVGSGSGTSSGEVMLLNGSSTIGDSLLISTVTGDTAYIKNILAGSGLLIEAMGDTVLKINIDSSTVPNIYNSGGTITTYNQIDIIGEGTGILFNATQTDSAVTQFGLVTDRIYFTKMKNATNYIASGFIAYMNEAVGSNPNLSILAAGGLYIGDHDIGDTTASIYSWNTDNIMPYYGVSDTLMYWNPSTGRVMRAKTGQNLSTKANSGNATLVIADNYVILSDLTGASARTVTLPSSASGKTITIVNKSSDGALKWTFASTVKDISGATVTAIDDLSAYTLLGDGTDWIIINKY